MKKHLLKNIAVFAVIIMPMLAMALPALATGPDIGMNYAGNFQLAGTNDDPRDMAVNVVKYLMTFLGIIAVVVILLGGFKWLTASGNEDKIADAKKTIIAGIIGLIVVLAAFAIVQFIVGTTSNMIVGGTP